MTFYCHCPLFRSATYTPLPLSIVHCHKEQTRYLATSPTRPRLCGVHGDSHQRARVLRVCSALSAGGTPQQQVIRPEVQPYVRIIKDTGCRKGKLQLCARPTGRRGPGGSANRRGCICFSCENQWSQTDGGLFPHYLLPGSLKMPPPAPSWADGAQVRRKPPLSFPNPQNG